jgi:hypothetical protein
LAAAGAVALAGLVAVGVAWISDSDTTRAPASDQSDRSERREETAESLERCVALWNGPANSKQRAVLHTAALAGTSRSPAPPGAVPLARRVLVLRYSGAPQEDVGVGDTGVTARRGDCLVAHPSQVLFLYTQGAWQQVGYSPGLAFQGIPQRATSSPNAVMAIRRAPAPRSREAGRIELLEAGSGV